MRWHIRLLALLLCAAGMATAYPTLTGPTGLIALPTGDLPVSGIHLAADTQKLDEGRAVPLRAQVVLGHGIEFGALFNPFTDNSPLDTASGANVKIAMPYDDGIRVGVGAQLVRQKTFAGLQTDYWQGYVAWTTDFQPEIYDVSNLTLTLGANWTVVDPPFGGNTDAFRGFFGAQFHLSDSLVIIAEYQTAERRIGDTDPIVSLGGRLRMGDILAVQGGVTNAQSLLGGPRRTVFLGASLFLATPAAR